MPTIGERLREARMRQKVDITEVEQATKIRAKYLRALENEEFDALPGPTFVRSFLKTYSDYLGLDSRVLVEEYRAGHEPPPEEEAPHFAPAPPRRRERPFRPSPGGGGPSPGLIAGGVLAAVVGLLLVLGLTGGDSDSGGERPAAPADEGRPADERDRERAARARRRRAAQRRTVSLRVVPSGPTYVCVDRGSADNQLFEGTLEEPRTFRGRRLRINLGRASGRLVANGRPVEVEPGPDPVGFAFTAGRKPRSLPIGQRPCA